MPWWPDGGMWLRSAKRLSLWLDHFGSARQRGREKGIRCTKTRKNDFRKSLIELTWLKPSERWKLWWLWLLGVISNSYWLSIISIWYLIEMKMMTKRNTLNTLYLLKIQLLVPYIFITCSVGFKNLIFIKKVNEFIYNLENENTTIVDVKLRDKVSKLYILFIEWLCLFIYLDWKYIGTVIR